MFYNHPFADDARPSIFFNMSPFPPTIYPHPKPHHNTTPRRSRREHLVNPEHDNISITTEDTTDIDPWYSEHYEPIFPRRRHPKSSTYLKRDFDAVHTPALRKLNIAVPSQRVSTSGLSANEILILPHVLTHLRVEITYEQRAGTSTFRVAAAGDMRLREMVRDLVPGRYVGDAGAWVKEAGEWREVDLRMRVGDVGEMGNVVKVKLGIERSGRRWME